MFEIFNEIINEFYKEADEFIEGRKENNMSEEEMIKNIEKDIFRFNDLLYFYETDNLYDWINIDEVREKIKTYQGILDLYKKEKDYAMGLYYDVQGLQQDLDKEKEKNKELKMQLEVEKIDNKYNKEETYEETIPRYIIRAELKELENMKVEGEVFSTSVNFAKKILKELLEEGEQS